MLRHTFFFAQQPADSDMLLVGKYSQRALAEALLDMFGGSTSPFYTGGVVTAGSGLTVNIAPIRVYYGLPMDATPWGTSEHGLPADSTTVLKFGTISTATTNYSDTTTPNPFVVPSSGSNYYLLEATIVEQDINLGQDVFQDSQQNVSAQYEYNDRAVVVQFKVKGPNTSATPSADAGYVGIAAITIPAGAVAMQASYISQAGTAPFTGFATIASGSGYVHLSPGSADSGFVSITGNFITANGDMQFGAASGAVLTSNANTTSPAFVLNAVNSGFTTGDLLDIQIGGVTKFSVPYTGILPVAYGGTGSSAPTALGGTGITVSGAWPNQTISFNSSYILPVANGGTGTATPGDIGGTGINVSGAWPTQTISFAPGLPLPVVFGGTGTATPSLVAGAGISITGSFPNQTIAATANPVGSVITSGGSSNTGAGTGVVQTVQITLPSPSTTVWQVEVVWMASGSSETSYINLSVGSELTGFTSSSGGSGTDSFLGAQRVATAHGGQTLYYNLVISGSGNLNQGTYVIRATRLS